MASLLVECSVKSLELMKPSTKRVPSVVENAKLFFVHSILATYNAILETLRLFLFENLQNPENILISKIGNIGDIICAIPSFIAIRKAYPSAKITLLTSPGNRGMLGANDLLKGVSYLDSLIIYYADDISDFNGKKNLLKKLKNSKFDLFIQIPDDYAYFKTMLRNLFVAKLIGVRSAFGFRVRTLLNVFKNTQVDYLFAKTEVENILDVLKQYIPIHGKPEFEFNIPDSARAHVQKIIVEKFGNGEKKIVIVNPGAKREANEWPVERFHEVARHLAEKEGVRIVVIGGPKDVEKAKIIGRGISESHFAIVAGELNLLETVEFMKHAGLVLSNDTGAAHMAAAVGTPVVGIYNVRNVFGKWFPYGEHKILYHKFLSCDYRSEECMKKSIEMVSVNEVINACEAIIKHHVH